MKYTLYDTVTEQEATEFFFSDPKLVLLGLSDEEIVEMYRTKTYELLPDTYYLSIKNEAGKIVCIVKYEYFSSITVNYHMYVSTSEQNNAELYAQIIPMIKKYGTEQDIHKAILIVPSTCTHVNNFAIKSGFEIEGRLKNSFQWRNSLVDLIIYGIEILENH